jgi:outer membrane receptor protein involved in Fe transport
MTRLSLLGASALSSSAFVGFAVLIAAPAHAQGAAAASQNRPPAGEVAAQSGTNPDAEGSASSIVVTGTRIRRPNLESTVPITSIGGEQFFQQGDTNVGETLNDLPQLRSTFAQQNPGSGIGIAGLNLLDLRGLGTQRTLVLVNGRRHVPADILNNAVSVDVNTIPNDLIERVDIVTGGNSAIYGSDAIAGVVNFVLRQNFEGLQVRGHAAISAPGFGGQQYFSAMYGMNFGGGRGNITLHGEYDHQDRIFASDLPWARQNNSLQTVDADTGVTADNFPDRVFINDVRSASIHYNGLVTITQPINNNPLCGRGTAANNGPPNSDGTPYNCTYIFTNAGQLIQQTGTRFGSGVIGGIAGGNGQTGREYHTVSILPFLERVNFNLLAHYDFSDAFQVFVEAKWNRVNALGNNAGPSFIQGQQTQFDFREKPRLDNPFLSAADRATLSSLILASGCNTSLTVACNTGTTAVGGVAAGADKLSAADLTAIANGSYRFLLSKNLLDVGLRDEHFRRDTYRGVVGLRGTFNTDWTYELSANYGKFKEHVTTDGFIDRQRFVLAMDSGRNPTTGQIQCRSQFDPASAIPIQRTDAVSLAIAQQNAARLAADIAACVPYNPFGSSADNTAAKAYFSREFTAIDSLKQLVLSGFVSGDTSGFFNFWGGPARFAVGAEYRREDAYYQQDPFVTQGFSNGVSIPTFAPNTFEVKEAYGELQLPILKDQPFFEELTLSGAARVAKYQGQVGTVWSYNAGADWAPVRDIRFRGNYSRAVRAPNVSETAFPLVPNFANGFVDPCQPAARSTGNRTANCTADLGPLLANLTDVTASLPIVSGSNPNLKAETSDSWTFGAVIQPRFIRGFSLSVDYYRITVKNIITSLSAQAIVNSCYDAASIQNVFCQQFTRWRGPGLGPNGEVPGRILGNSLIAAPLNFARRERKGIDVNLTYRTAITPDVKLDTNLILTHNLKISNYQDPTNPNFETRVLGTTGDPRNEFRWDVDLGYKEFTLGYRMRFVGRQWVSQYGDFNSLNGLPPANADFADTIKIPQVMYHDLRFEWNIKNGHGIGRDLQFYYGVDNLLDKHPPLGILATGAGPGALGNAGLYEVRGRTFYGGFRARF